MLQSYEEEFPHGTENLHLKKYEELESAKNEEMGKLHEKTLEWDPENDEHIKGTDPFRTVFIGRLPYEVTEVELQKHFSRFGEIEKVRVVRDKSTSKSRGYAFIVFRDETGSRAACKEIGVHRGLDIQGRSVIVDIERGRTVKYFKPRRLGGGLGGRGYKKREKMAKFQTSPDETRVRSFQPSRFSGKGSSRFRQDDSSRFRQDDSPRNRYNRYGNGPPQPSLPQQQDHHTPMYRSRQDRFRAPSAANRNAPPPRNRD